MQVELKVLTLDGGSYATAAGQTGKLTPGARIVLDDPVSITLTAPVGEALGESVQLDPAIVAG